MSSGDEAESRGVERRQPELPDEDTLRILVSTDNHLGYLERDPVRGLDSFAAFEEVLYLAKLYKADMVLIAGDLFHDNKPSRNTMHKTMEIIRRYCMGPDPVQIQIVSNQESNFRGLNGTVNYEDEFYSIDLPVFSIHGNHDDPTRDGGAETLAALDLLSVSNLVNYFGRQDVVDKVEVAPILIRKGSTNVALYGMGSMRDERLNRMWQSKKISFLRPESDVDGEEQQQPNDDDMWFNLFTLHQNRDTGRGAKNCIHESMIPEWFDLVVWGHEHECVIDPMESTVGTFRIVQPGSSVATSLTPGEAIRKQVGVLDIKGRQFRQTAVPLTQVRSFFMAEMSLRERPELDADDPKVDSKIAKVLEDQVNVLIFEAKQKRKHLLDDAHGLGNSPKDVVDKIKFTLAKPDQVLIRLKVDHSNFSVLNNQRFGSKFVGQVGNPTDILLFARKKGESTGKSGKKKSTTSLDMPILPEDPGELKVELLIAEGLEASGNRLEILEETKLHSALEMYVEKDGKSAIEDTFSGLLSRQQKALEKRRNNDVSVVDESVDASAVGASAADDLRSEEDGVKENRRVSRPAARGRKRPSQMDLDDSFDEVVPAPRKKTVASQRSNGTTKTSKGKRVLSISDDDEDDDFDSTPAPSRSRGRRTARAKPKYAVESDDESEAVISVGDEDDDVLEDMDDEVVEVKPTRKRGAKKASTPSAARKKKTPAAKKSTTKKKTSSSSSSRLSQLTLSFPSYTKSSTAKKKQSKRKRRAENSSDEDDGTFGSSYGAPKDWGTASTNTQR